MSTFEPILAPPPMNCGNISTDTPVRVGILVFVNLTTLLWVMQLVPNGFCVARAPQSTEETSHRSGIKLKAVRIGNGQTKDGVWYSFTKIEAEDGSLAYNLVIPFPSVKRADEELQGRIKLATKVIRSRPQIDKQGKTVGQRVLALYAGKSASIPLVRL